MVGRLSIESGGEGRVHSFRLWAFWDSLRREMRTKCWANKSLVVAVTEAMTGVSARARARFPRHGQVPRSSPSVLQ